jgi:hypothetical protein
MNIQRVPWRKPVPFILSRLNHIGLPYPQTVQDHFYNVHFRYLSSSSPLFCSSLPSGDRLASIVFLFEVSFPPNIDDAAPRLPLFPFFLAAAWALFLFIFSEAGFVFLCWPKRDLSFSCGASEQIKSN